jgi:hypothetical protein
MIDTPVSLTTLETLPASPRDISPEINLSDLEQIRAGWLEQAQAQQLPERLFQIGYWLGTDYPTLHAGIHKLFEIDNIKVWAVIVQTSYNVPAKAWNTTRRLTVYRGDLLVMDWRWYYTTGEIDIRPLIIPEGDPAEMLYIPGEWVSRALALHPKAEATRIGIARSASIADRDALARRLLVGREV